MTSVVVDTTVLVDVLRRRPAARAAIWHARRDGGDLTAPTTVRFEVLAGLKRGEEEATMALFAVVDWVPVSAEIADAAASYSRRYSASFSGIDLGDYVLAATADLMNARILTLNVRHFPMFPELAPAY